MTPIDWNEHWALHREPENATQFAIEMAERVGRFIDERDIRDAADFGCGPATTLFKLAKMYPSIDFFGFDIAESIIRKNRERAKKGGHDNLFFEQDSLPLLRHSGDLTWSSASQHCITSRTSMRLSDRFFG